MHYNTFNSQLKALGFSKDGRIGHYWTKSYSDNGQGYIEVRVCGYNFAFDGHDWGIADMEIRSGYAFSNTANAASFDRPDRALQLANDLISLNERFTNWTKQFADKTEKVLA